MRNCELAGDPYLDCEGTVAERLSPMVEEDTLCSAHWGALMALALRGEVNA